MKEILALVKECIPDVEKVEEYNLSFEEGKKYGALNKIAVLDNSDATKELYGKLEELFHQQHKAIKFHTSNGGWGYLTGYHNDEENAEQVIIFYPEEELELPENAKKVKKEGMLEYFYRIQEENFNFNG